MPEVAELYARVRAQVDEAVANLNQVQSELAETGEAGQQAGAGVDAGMQRTARGSKQAQLSITDLRQGILLLAGAARTLKNVAEAAFEFTREGAALTQLADTARNAGIDVDELGSLMQGTVSDSEIAAAGLALLAGTTGETRQGMAELTPEVFSLAKQLSSVDAQGRSAANILDIVSRAVKRQSELILDDAQIYLDRETAYERFAVSLGKERDELTAQEETLAFTIGTVESMRQSIEDLGGTLEADTDSWDRLHASTKTYLDMVKEDAADSLQPLIDKLADTAGGAVSTREELMKLALIYPLLQGDPRQLPSALGGGPNALDALSGNSERVTQELIAQAELIWRHWETIPDVYNDVGVAVPRLEGPTNDLSGAQDAAADSTEALARAQKELQMMMDTSITDTQKRYADNLGNIQDRMQGVQEKLDDYTAKNGQVIDAERDRADVLRELGFAEEEVRLAQERLNQAASEQPEIDLTALRDSAREAESQLRSVESQLDRLSGPTFYGPNDRLRIYQDEMLRQQLLAQQREAMASADTANQDLGVGQAQADILTARDDEIAAQETQLRLEQQLYWAQQDRADLLKELNAPPEVYDYSKEIADLQQQYADLQADYRDTLADRERAEKETMFNILQSYLEMDGELSADDTGILVKAAEKWGLIDQNALNAYQSAQNYANFIKQNEMYFYRAPFLPPAGIPGGTQAQFSPVSGGKTPGITLYGDLIVQGGSIEDILDQVQQAVP